VPPIVEAIGPPRRIALIFAITVIIDDVVSMPPVPAVVTAPVMATVTAVEAAALAEAAMMARSGPLPPSASPRRVTQNA